MHIDQKQFLELITEAGGIDPEKAEKQLAKLISEIRQSLEEDEAYEIEGFGIFSSLGNRIMFIPSTELETEINFKYVGMEPIELDEPSPSFDDPFDGLGETTEDSEKSPSVDQRFAGLIDDISEFEEPEEETPGPDEWGVEAHKEDASADRLFASLMGEEYETPIKEEEGIDASESDEFDEFGDVFGESEEPDNSIDLGAEVASFMDQNAQEEEENSVDDELDDIFTNEEEPNVEEDIFIEETDVLSEEEAPEITEAEQEPSEEIAPVLELKQIDEVDKDIDLEDEIESDKTELEFEDVNDFDDPFLTLEDAQVDESILRLEELDETEIVPVIRNISTEVPEGEETPAKEKKKEKSKKEKKKKEKPKKEKSESPPAPAWMWVLLIVVVLGGGVAGLGYFNIISIPFISPQTASNTTQPVQTQTPPPAPVAQPEVAESQPQTTETTSEQTVDPVTEEQSPVAQVPVQEVTDNPVSADADQYGLTGVLSENGNDGYTIILYTLSNQQNAINERQKLLDNGYRGFLTPVPSERHGTLFRVSVGQFATLFDAAVAAEEIENLLPENYIIKKIN